MRRHKIMLLGLMFIIMLLIGAGCESVQPGGTDILDNRRPIQNRIEDERERWVMYPTVRPGPRATMARAESASEREEG